MAGATGTALEWALALSRAPMERHALRQRALPDGVEAVLAIAADAAPELLEQAVRASGEPAASIREAARFYVREILLFPAADAYRTLGVPRAADSATIKAHHRLLQHWLHPDRTASAEDAVFAARVNAAWNRLRHPRQREAYDDTLAINAPVAVVAASSAPAGWRGAHAALPDAPVAGWQRATVLGLVAVSALLGLLAWREQGRHPEQSADAKDGAGTFAAADAGIVDVLGAPDASASRIERQARQRPRASVPTPTRTHAPVELAHKPDIAVGSLANPKPRMELAPVAAQLQPQPIPRNLPLSSAPLPAAVDSEPQPAITTVAPAKPPVSPTAAIAVKAVENGAPASPVLPPPVSNRPAMSAAPALPSLARIESARRIGQQLLRYMADRRRPPPPIWNSPAIESSADQLRNAIAASGTLRLQEPEWRIGTGTAALRAGYEAGGDRAERGSVSADLVWREGQWLVVGLSMERAR